MIPQELLQRPEGDWNPRQLTKEEAKALFDSGDFARLSDEEIFNLAFFQRLLCVPFAELHRVTEKVFGRSVWTHEFAFRDGLLLELRQQKEKPTMEQIVGLLPKEKVLVMDPADGIPRRLI